MVPSHDWNLWPVNCKCDALQIVPPRTRTGAFYANWPGNRSPACLSWPHLAWALDLWHLTSFCPKLVELPTTHPPHQWKGIIIECSTMAQFLPMSALLITLVFDCLTSKYNQLVSVPKSTKVVNEVKFPKWLTGHSKKWRVSECVGAQKNDEKRLLKWKDWGGPYTFFGQ